MEERTQTASLIERAKTGDKDALTTMLSQFVSSDEQVLLAEYFGKSGWLWFGKHSFGFLTNRRVACIQTGSFGEVVFQDGHLDSINGCAVYQPSRLEYFFSLVIGILMAPLFLGMNLFGLKNSIKSGLIVTVAEGMSLSIFCDRKRIRHVNHLVRLMGEVGRQSRKTKHGLSKPTPETTVALNQSEVRNPSTNTPLSVQPQMVTPEETLKTKIVNNRIKGESFDSLQKTMNSILSYFKQLSFHKTAKGNRRLFLFWIGMFCFSAWIAVGLFALAHYGYSDTPAIAMPYSKARLEARFEDDFVTLMGQFNRVKRQEYYRISLYDWGYISRNELFQEIVSCQNLDLDPISEVNNFNRPIGDRNVFNLPHHYPSETNATQLTSMKLQDEATAYKTSTLPLENVSRLLFADSNTYLQDTRPVGDNESTAEAAVLSSGFWNRSVPVTDNQIVSEGVFVEAFNTLYGQQQSTLPTDVREYLLDCWALAEKYEAQLRFGFWFWIFFPIAVGLGFGTFTALLPRVIAKRNRTKFESDSQARIDNFISSFQETAVRPGWFSNVRCDDRQEVQIATQSYIDQYWAEGSIFRQRQNLQACLAFLLGALGIHLFARGQFASGGLRLIFSCTYIGLFIMIVVGWIEGIKYLCVSNRHFTKHYIIGDRTWF